MSELAFKPDNEFCQKALIYCRVSSKSQKKGSGLSSQEHRCRQYAQAKNYDVCEVFRDDVTGGGDFIKRKGMVQLLRYMDDHPQYRFVIIFDDLKRYSRDTEFHLALKREMLSRGATRECLNFNFEETPEGAFFETIVTAHGTLERQQNARQTRQKTIARLEQGYWTFSKPLGYMYVSAKEGGRVLIKDPVLAPIIKEGLEGYASGRFATQTEVQRFFESQAAYPKNKHGKVYKQSVPKLLRKEVYAGLLSCEAYGVSQRKAKHEPLISIETFHRIQAKFGKGVYAPMRKDVNEAFPLRGGVCCASCAKPLTAAWCQGKNKKYPYYYCVTRGCNNRSKTIARAKLHEAFEALLGRLKPSEEFVRVFTIMFKMQWEQRVVKSADIAKGFAREAQMVEKSINGILDKILHVSNPRVIAAYESRIEEMEQQKMLFIEKSQNTGKPKTSFEDLIKHAFKFLSNPEILWKSNRLDLQRLTLRLAFAEPMSYDRDSGVLNTNLSLPFKVLGNNFIQAKKMAEKKGFEPSMGF